MWFWDGNTRRSSCLGWSQQYKVLYGTFHIPEIKCYTIDNMLQNTRMCVCVCVFWVVLAFFEYQHVINEANHCKTDCHVLSLIKLKNLTAKKNYPNKYRKRILNFLTF